MRLTDAIIEFRYAKDWTTQSRKWYASRLAQFTDWCADQQITDLEQVTPPLVRRYIAYLQNRPARRHEKLGSHTVHGHVRVIRALLNWGVQEDLVDEKLPKRIQLPKKEEQVLAILSDKQMDMLFAAAQRTHMPLRDTALLALLLDTGCRASELCGLKLTDVTFTPDSAWILVHGKGRKQREVALGKRARLALSRYLHRERRSDLEYVFVGRRGRLTSFGLDRLLYRLRDAAGAEHFTGVSVAAHRWRHTHAVKSLDAGMDMYVLSKQLGHSEISTTTNYLRAVSARQLRQLTVSPLDVLSMKS
ncbi:MAG TPA: tyrosine-type recombinase/integrase [Ktedonobacterales bacterium]|nr:tyrosine-type recombinase/integrase [Ktedonobacterales bacterium]